MDMVPVMLDSKSSFAEILQQKTDASLISLFHCIIQIGNIYAGFSEADSMKNTVEMVINIISQRCENDINYRQLIEMLK